MAERETLVTNRNINYEGLFSLADLYETIDELFEEMGYDKHEMKNIERVYDDHKYVEIEIEPWKKITDYAESRIKIRIQAENLKEVEIVKDGVKVKMNKGNLIIAFNVFLHMDYEGKWESKPMLFFMRVLLDKFFFGSYTKQYKGEIMHDYGQVVNKIQSYLNLYKLAGNPNKA